MKKLIMTAAVVACASIVSAQVYSDNIVGYVKVTKPANGDLNMVGVSFVATSQTLEGLFPSDQFEGDLFLASASDQVIIWNNGADSYETYVYYDVSSVYGPSYESYDGWQTLAGFGGASYANPTLPAGTAFWFQGAGTTAGDLLALGEVKQEETASQAIAVGLQQLANPFASDSTIGELVGTQASGDLFLASGSDQIIVWDTVAQAYATYVYYDVSSVYGPSYESYDGWQTLAGFGGATYADDTVIPVGQGFWYQAVSGFTWTANKNY